MKILFLSLANCVLIRLFSNMKYLGKSSKKLTNDGDRVIELVDLNNAIDFTPKKHSRGLKIVGTFEPIKLGISDDGYLSVKPLKDPTDHFDVNEMVGDSFTLRISHNCVEYLPIDDYFGVRTCNNSDMQKFIWDDAQVPFYKPLTPLKPIPTMYAGRYPLLDDSFRPTLKKFPYFRTSGVRIKRPNLQYADFDDFPDDFDYFPDDFGYFPDDFGPDFDEVVDFPSISDITPKNKRPVSSLNRPLTKRSVSSDPMDKMFDNMPSFNKPRTSPLVDLLTNLPLSNPLDPLGNLSPAGQPSSLPQFGPAGPSNNINPPGSPPGSNGPLGLNSPSGTGPLNENPYNNPFQPQGNPLTGNPNNLNSTKNLSNNLFDKNFKVPKDPFGNVPDALSPKNIGPNSPFGPQIGTVLPRLSSNLPPVPTLPGVIPTSANKRRNLPKDLIGDPSANKPPVDENNEEDQPEDSPEEDQPDEEAEDEQPPDENQEQEPNLGPDENLDQGPNYEPQGDPSIEAPKEDQPSEEPNADQPSEAPKADQPSPDNPPEENKNETAHD